MIKIAFIITASIYVLWGIIHHRLRGDLHLKIVLEYLGIALLGLAVIFSVINFL